MSARYEHAVISVRDPDRLEDQIEKMASSGYRLVAYQTAVVDRMQTQGVGPSVDHYAIMEREAVEDSGAMTVQEMRELLSTSQVSRDPGQ